MPLTWSSLPWFCNVSATDDIKEEFIGFIHCDEDTSREALSEKITSYLADMGIDMDNCRG